MEGWINKVWFVLYEILFSFTKKKILLYVIIWMSFSDIIVNEILVKDCMILFIISLKLLNL